MHDVAPGFTNYRFFNHTQTVLLPLLVLLVCLTPKPSRLRVFWLGLVSLWWMIIYATTARGTVVGLLAGSAFAAVVLRQTAIDYLKTMGASALIGVVFYAVFLVALPTLAGQQPFDAFSSGLSRTAADPGSMRGFVWKNAFNLILQHPWLGVGPMHFAHDAARFGWAAHPHDWILQIGAEWGVPALLCLSYALYRGVRALAAARGRSAQVDGGSLVLAALLVGAGAILVDGLVSGLIVMPQSQLAIALYLGMAIGWYRVTMPALDEHPQATGLRVANAALMLAAVAGVAWGMYPEIVNVMTNQPPSAEIHALNSSNPWPRLWYEGFF